ncbi:hypothetical protein DYI95_010530 [Thermaerobacter sp. PB12/4term]|uniref:hypothetical protein n=1 Tax=Thermaerobacter sp. PB12/4term TaxID=2293838 RepID=UPI000E32B113|nr:hypothetical protein [Thermaerobacter sp. PB12/4term]QIA27888.1 hypothetical protein DYI95_010530 [Thermaerobacter sp. PB12/4term]
MVVRAGQGAAAQARPSRQDAVPAFALQTAAAPEAGRLDAPAWFARLHRLVRKRQVRIRIDRRGVVNLYRQRAQVEPALYLTFLAQAYAHVLAALLAALAGLFLLRERAWQAGLAAATGAAVIELGAQLARWRRERRWVAGLRRRLLEDPVFFAQAYEDGLFALQRGRRLCRYPRPWQAIFGLEDAAAEEEVTVVVRRPAPASGPPARGSISVAPRTTMPAAGAAPHGHEAAAPQGSPPGTPQGDRPAALPGIPAGRALGQSARLPESPLH